MSSAGKPFRAVRLDVPDFDPRLRAAKDDDPLVEEMVERLRRGLGGLVAVDAWGQPLSWRDVVRTALGTSLGELRDHRTARALAAALPEQQLTLGRVPERPPVPGLRPEVQPVPGLAPPAEPTPVLQAVPAAGQ